MFISQKKRNQIKEQVKIIDIVNEFNLGLKSAGKYYSTEAHDSIRIDADSNRYRQFSVSKDNEKWDDVIQFMQDIPEINYSYKEAIAYLVEKIDPTIAVKNAYPEQSATKKKHPIYRTFEEVVKVHKSIREKLFLEGETRHAIAYLTKTRCIDEEIVMDLVNRNQIKQENVSFSYQAKDSHGKPLLNDDGTPLMKEGTNRCVTFLGTTEYGTIANATRRSCNPDSTFKGNVAGGDLSYGWMYIPRVANTMNWGIEKIDGKDSIKQIGKKMPLVITESCIDLLSFATHNKQIGKAYDKCAYMSISSVNNISSAVANVKRFGFETVCIALDNDKAGREATEKLKAELSQLDCKLYVSNVPDNHKDWNEYLVGKTPSIAQKRVLAKAKYNEMKKNTPQKEISSKSVGIAR